MVSSLNSRLTRPKSKTRLTTKLFVGPRAVPEVVPQHTLKPRRTLKAVTLKAATWLVAGACFYLVYKRISTAAANEGFSAFTYLANFFANANWTLWLCAMVPYSVFFFLVDSHVTWRAIRWFNAPRLCWPDVMTIRASAYIMSLVNEGVSKGAMSLYLAKRHEVPGWQALSTMIYLGLMEVCQLLFFACLGFVIHFDSIKQASSMLPLDLILPALFISAAVYLPLHIAYFRGHILKQVRIRDIAVFQSFQKARIHHYALTLLFKAPNMLGAVVVYTIALDLFGVEASLWQMFVFLPLIFLAAALPLPFHAGALLLWTVLFPDYPEVGAFSLVMHTSFVLLNATIGLMFLPRANRQLWGD